MKTIIGAAIGNCVHIAGLYNFLKLAETEGYYATLLGSAIPVKKLVETIVKEKPTILAISYRLTPEVALSIFNELKNEIKKVGYFHQRIIFGGPPSIAAIARDAGVFEKVFSGEETVEEIKHYLSGGIEKTSEKSYKYDLIGRINQKYPYPLIRHHFGRPSLDETLTGVKTIAQSGVLDVISIGPDQNAQEYFFHPEKMDHTQDGAGGVPLRKADDLRAIYSNSRCGNYPLVRCYAGTRDLIRWAQMSVETIHNAWAAIPLCWYSEMDNRSSRTLEEAIKENQKVIKWYARNGIPVEVNESHQWSLRDAHDSLAVTMAFLAAYNAKKLGVHYYVSQFMLNTPPSTSVEMDLAKMLAKKELIEELEDEHFTMYREVRAGLSHFSSNPSIAKGQLAASAVAGLSLKPHIYHVVSYSEGDHATLPNELIESCEIIHGVLRNCLNGMPDMTKDKLILKRKIELIQEARVLLNAIWDYGKEVSNDPWTDPFVISMAIRNGLLDTPHFQGNQKLCGKIRTRSFNGAWHAVDENSGNPIHEKERTAGLLKYIQKLTK
jgi:hypothetical protein